MGNQNNKLIKQPSLHELQSQLQIFIKGNDFNQYYHVILQTIFFQRRMNTSLINIIKTFPTKQTQELFLQEVQQANLLLLDSFYEHLYLNKMKAKQPEEEESQGLCGKQKIKKSWDIVSDEDAYIINMNDIQEIQHYEQLKQQGLNLIMNQSVVFILLAGGHNLRFGSNTFKQCQSFTLPSQDSLIKIILKRLQALGTLINTKVCLYILCSSRKKKRVYEEIIQNLKIQFINITYIMQACYGCLDVCGRLIVDDDSHVFKHPNGTGDLWGFFETQHNFLKQFKYAQIFGLSNSLQHCFDCYMIGKTHKSSLPWTTLTVDDLLTKNESPILFINKMGQIQVSDPVDMDYPRNCPTIFANNSVVSIQFIYEAINHNKWLQSKKYRCKLHYFPSLKKKIIDVNLPNYFQQKNKLGSYDKILVFQKCHSDIFKMSKIMNKKKGCIIKVQKQPHYSSYIWKNDLKKCSNARSNLHKKWLGIQEQSYPMTPFQNSRQKQNTLPHDSSLKVCEVDPFISLQGQNLQQIKYQLSQTIVTFPLHLLQDNEPKISLGFKFEDQEIQEEEDFDDLPV